MSELAKGQGNDGCENRCLHSQGKGRNLRLETDAGWRSCYLHVRLIGMMSIIFLTTNLKGDQSLSGKHDSKKSIFFMEPMSNNHNTRKMVLEKV